MLKTRHQLDLAREAFCQFGSGVGVGQQNLHGLDAVRNEVADLEDLAHAATPEQRQDLVITDSLADV